MNKIHAGQYGFNWESVAYWCQVDGSTVDVYLNKDASRGHVRLYDKDAKAFINFLNQASVGAGKHGEDEAAPRLADDQFPLSVKRVRSSQLAPKEDVYVFDSRGLLVGRALSSGLDKAFGPVTATFLSQKIGEFDNAENALSHLLKHANAGRKEQP